VSFTLAAPRCKRGQKLAFGFDEDDLTLAWDAVRKASLPAGARVDAAGLAVPPWFFAGLGLVAAPDAALVLRPVATTVGPTVVLHGRDAAPDVEHAARAAYALAPTRPEAPWQAQRVARDGPDTEADFPLGAFVTQARHDEVTARRMALPEGTVLSWTTIGAGAAPTEFARLQAAVGAYHAVLVGFPDGARTVGLWTEEAPPATGDAARPVLRRLFRTQGAWRHGVKFGPPDDGRTRSF
jgi:hypothetical protein